VSSGARNGNSNLTRSSDCGHCAKGEVSISPVSNK
jgi:hypothetical protein